SNRAEIWHKLVWLLLIFLASISLPLVFLIQSYLSSETVSQLKTSGHWLSALGWLVPNFDRYFSWHFDVVYFWANNLHLILLLAALLGIGLVIRKNLRPTLSPYFWTFFILLCNYFFLSNLVKFSFLIDYEQNNYPGRLLEIGFYFLIPFILAAWQFIFSRTGQWRQGAGILALALLILNSLYFSYPRANKFEPGHNISTSQTDIETVHSIDQAAAGDYVVLANQSVSAAALKEFGFKKYFQTNRGQVFFYPIPTGGPLYQYYLDMVYGRPSAETVKKASELTGAKQAFFVINKYWSGYQRIVETAKAESLRWWPVSDSAFVFEYRF
ncbi:hypothetical protein HY224_01660, partial [Candidatus Uhrbacteria bacterium]|nr:hypothetical protein [Candidatus Uhrbacteria bacterium]